MAYTHQINAELCVTHTQHTWTIRTARATPISDGGAEPPVF